MRLHRLLAATLAAFFVAGCSSEKFTSPKAGASVGPQQKPSVKPSREAASAPPPKADPPPATATASPPAQDQDPPKDTPPAPPDPWAGVDAEWRPIYKEFAGLLEPTVTKGVEIARALKQLSQGDSKALPEELQRDLAVVRLSRYDVPFPRKAEIKLRALLADVKDRETGAEQYLAAVDSLLAGPVKGHMLAAAYECVFDEGADIPADTRQKLAKLIRSREPQEAFAQGPRNAKGVISEEAEYLRTKLLEQSVKASDIFKLAVLIHRLAQSVIEKRELCRTFHDLVMALSEPHRSEVLMQLAWSPDQERALDREREKLKHVKPSRPNPNTVMMMPEDRFRYESEYARELASIAADRRKRFLALEQDRRDTIEGCFLNVDAAGSQALIGLDELFAGLQAVLDKGLPKFSYRLRPFIPADAPRDPASNVLSTIPLPGSAEDRVPTMRISDFEIVFDAPARPLTAAAASPPAQDQGPTKDTPPSPDPYAGVDAKWRPYYEQFKELLEPSFTAGGAKVQAGCLSEDEQKKFAVVRLGAYKVCLNREAERRLRALLADVKATETEAHWTKYLAAVDSLVAGPVKGRMLAAACEQVINERADIPAGLRQKLAELIRSNDPQAPHARRPSYTTGNIAQETESLRTKLLEQSVTGNDFLKLAIAVNALGQSVIERRTLCRTFHDLVMALPEPRRSDVLTQLGWSPEQEANLDRERVKLKEVKPSRPNPKAMMRMPKGHFRYDWKRIESGYARELEWIAADRRKRFRALEQARRDTIEGCFHHMDRPGWQALVALDVLVAELQAVLDAILPDFGYQLRPLIPADAPRDAASNVLSTIPLAGSVEDGVPTIRVSDNEIVFDAPAGNLSYANLLKPGNVLVGTLRMEDQPEALDDRATTYHAELHIRAIEKKVVRGELVVEAPAGGRQVNIPFKGEVGPNGFSFEASTVVQGELIDLGTFTGSLDKGGPLTGTVRRSSWLLGSFSFSLKK